MTRTELQRFFEKRVNINFGFSEEWKEIVKSFIVQCVNEIPGPEFTPETGEFLQLTPSELLDRVCFYTGVPKERVVGKSRKDAYVAVRQLFCLASKQIFGDGYSLNHYGRLLGGRHHTTIIYSVSEALNRFDTNDALFMSFFSRVFPKLREEKLIA